LVLVHPTLGSGPCGQPVKGACVATRSALLIDGTGPKVCGRGTVGIAGNGLDFASLGNEIDDEAITGQRDPNR